MYLSLNNDIKNQLSMVPSCVNSISVGSICDNAWFKRYVQGLNENHCPPYRLKQVRLAKLYSDACRKEFFLIFQEHYVDLTYAFI